MSWFRAEWTAPSDKVALYAVDPPVAEGLDFIPTVKNEPERAEFGSFAGPPAALDVFSFQVAVPETSGYPPRLSIDEFSSRGGVPDDVVGVNTAAGLGYPDSILRIPVNAVMPITGEVLSNQESGQGDTDQQQVKSFFHSILSAGNRFFSGEILFARWAGKFYTMH